jgi:hypothetical protein
MLAGKDWKDLQSCFIVCCLIIILIIFSHLRVRFLGFSTFNKRPFLGFSNYIFTSRWEVFGFLGFWILGLPNADRIIAFYHYKIGISVMQISILLLKISILVMLFSWVLTLKGTWISWFLTKQTFQSFFINDFYFFEFCLIFFLFCGTSPGSAGHPIWFQNYISSKHQLSGRGSVKMRIPIGFFNFTLNRTKIGQPEFNFYWPQLQKKCVIWPVHLVWMTARLQQDTFLSWHLAPASEVTRGLTLPF